jgi:hypothetical protein
VVVPWVGAAVVCIPLRMRCAVIASEAKQSRGKSSMIAAFALDCFVAHAPRNDANNPRLILAISSGPSNTSAE